MKYKKKMEGGKVIKLERKKKPVNKMSVTINRE